MRDGGDLERKLFFFWAATSIVLLPTSASRPSSFQVFSIWESHELDLSEANSTIHLPRNHF